MTIENADPNSVQQLESEMSGEPQTAEPDMPAKFKGKTAAEIVAMYQAQESELGRKNNEVGQLRSLTDRVLGLAQATREQANQQPRKPIQTEDLLADPDRVVTDRINEVSNDRAQAAEARLAQMEGRLALSQFERKFPSYQADITDSKFQNWVTKSSLRQSLASRAAQGDYSSAEELFTLYNEVRPNVEKTDEHALEAAEKASLTKGGGSQVSASTTSKGKKIYSRADLIEMRINNREEFDRRFNDEFLPAYQEKRVR